MHNRILIETFEQREFLVLLLVPDARVPCSSIGLGGYTNQLLRDRNSNEVGREILQWPSSDAGTFFIDVFTKRVLTVQAAPYIKPAISFSQYPVCLKNKED